MQLSKKTFLYCEKCGKKLIERLPNGFFKFIFGGKQSPPPVELIIYGSIKMRCLRRNCGHFTIFNYFPNVFENNTQSEKKSEATLSGK